MLSVERFNPKTKTPSSRKTRKEGSTNAGDDRSPARPHPSLCGEAGSLRNRDEHNRAGILTPGLASLPPSLAVALGVCSPLQWRNRPRLSRGSLTRSCVFYGPRGPCLSKSGVVLSPPAGAAKGKVKHREPPAALRRPHRTSESAPNRRAPQIPTFPRR